MCVCGRGGGPQSFDETCSGVVSLSIQNHIFFCSLFLRLSVRLVASCFYQCQECKMKIIPDVERMGDESNFAYSVLCTLFFSPYLCRWIVRQRHTFLPGM